MPTYRPSARLTMTVRVEEYGDTAALEGRLEAAPSPLLTRRTPPTADEVEAELENVNETFRQLVQIRETLAPDEFQAFRQDLEQQRKQLQQRLVAAREPAQQPPEAVEGPPPDDRVTVGSIQPRTVQVERNGLETADKCTIELDFADAPFDPRTIRAAAVEVLVGVVDAQSFENGVRGATRDDGTLTSLVERRADGSIVGTATRFVGVVDDWDVRYDDENGDTIKLECRDMSAIPRAVKLNPGESIDLSLPLDDGIRQFLDSFPTTRGIEVVFEGAAPIPGDAIPASKKARRGRVSRRAKKGDSNETAWDHVRDVCAQVGFIPLFRGFELRIINPRTLYGRGDGVRAMVYGRNLKTLEFTRRLAGEKVPTIEVRSYDPQLGRTRWARYPTRRGERASGIFGRTDPPRALRANEVTPSGANPEEKIRTITVRGVTDPTVLERVARSAFEQIGRQEIEGNFATRDVSSWDLDRDTNLSFLDPDLLRIDAGDPVELLIAPTFNRDQQTTANVINSLGRNARAAYLQRRGWSRELAERFSALQEATGFQTVFRVKDARISWTQEEGIQISVGFINFIVVREEAGETSDGVSEPSDEVERITEGRNDEAAEAARRASALRRLLTSWRDNGIISDETYQRRIAELGQVEQQRVAAARRTS